MPYHLFKNGNHTGVLEYKTQISYDISCNLQYTSFIDPLLLFVILFLVVFVDIIIDSIVIEKYQIIKLLVIFFYHKN